MDHNDLTKRTKNFAVKIIELAKYLEEYCGNTGRKIGDQLLRSGTRVYANYRAACRCKSAKDFISKIGTVVEESDESLGWLELIDAANLIPHYMLEELLRETNEITAIMNASKTTAIRNVKRDRP